MPGDTYRALNQIPHPRYPERGLAEPTASVWVRLRYAAGEDRRAVGQNPGKEGFPDESNAGSQVRLTMQRVQKLESWLSKTCVSQLPHAKTRRS